MYTGPPPFLHTDTKHGCYADVFFSADTWSHPVLGVDLTIIAYEASPIMLTDNMLDKETNS